MKNLLCFIGVVVFSVVAAVLMLTVAPVILSILAAVLLPVIGICALLFPEDWEKAKNGEL